MLRYVIFFGLKLVGIGRSPGSSVTQNAEITQHIGESNIVEGSFRVLQAKDTKREPVTHLKLDTFGKRLEDVELPDDVEQVPGTTDLPYDSRKSPIPSVYGQETHGSDRRPSVLFLMHCYLQSPCEGTHEVGIGSVSGNAVTKDDRKGTNVQEVPDGSLGDGSLSFAYDSGHLQNLYTVSKVSSRYENIRMRTQMPISNYGTARRSTDPTSVVFDLAEPQSYRVIEIEAERVGKPPELPRPLDSYKDGGNKIVATLKHNRIKVNPPTSSIDANQLIYRATGTYWYMLARPLLESETISYGRHPFIGTSFADKQGEKLGDYYSERVGP